MNGTNETDVSNDTNVSNETKETNETDTIIAEDDKAAEISSNDVSEDKATEQADISNDSDESQNPIEDSEIKEIEKLSDDKKSGQADLIEIPQKHKNKLNRKQKKLLKTVIIIFILVLLGVAAFLYIRNRQNKARAAMKESMAGNIKTAQIEKKDLTESISVTGKIKSNESRTLLTTLQTSSKILAVNAEVGQYVNEGDVLVTFSTEDIEKEIARTEEDLSRQRQLDSITTADNQRKYVYSYQQAADTLQDNAKNTDRALQDLYEACNAYGDAKRALQTARDEGKSEAEISQLESQVASAKSKEESAQRAYDDAVLAESQSKGVESVANSLSEADSTYQTSLINAGDKAREKERTLEDQKDNLDNYVVTATMSGVVTKVNVAEGNSFKDGEVLTIQDISRLTVEAEIDEYDISRIKEGQRVIVRTEGTDDDEFDGIVSLVNPEATSSSSAGAASGSSSTATYTVKVDLLDNDDRLKLGMTAKMSIIIDEADSAMCVPYNAIGQNAAGESVVYVLDDMSVLEKGASHDTSPSKSKKDSDRSYKNDGEAPDSSANNSSSGIIVENDLTGEEGNSLQNAPEADADSQARNNKYHEVVVEKGIETDYYTQIITDKLNIGDYIVINKEDADSSSEGFPGGGAFGMPGGGGGGMGGSPPR